MDDRSRGNAPSDFSLSLRAIWWVAFAFFAAMAAVWAFSIVPMGGPDEPAHTVKAVAIVRGHFETRVHKIALDKGPQVPRTRLRVPMGYRVPLLPSCRARDPLTSCEPEFGRGDGEMLTDTYVGAYPPTYYALVGWPSLFAAGEAGLFGMRVASGLLCAALVASGITSAVGTSRRFLLVGYVLAITPVVVFLTGAINPISIEIAAALCFWTSLLSMFNRPDTVDNRLLARITISGVVLTLTRILSPAFLIVIVAVVLLIAGDRATLAQLWTDRRVRLAAGILAMFAVLSTAFIVLNRSYSSFIGWPNVGNAFAATGGHVQQQVGTLGWNNVVMPGWLTQGWIAAGLVFVAVALVVGSWRHRAVLVAMVLGCLALPIVAQALSTGQYKPKWQGRYALPLTVGIPILAGWICDRSGRISQRAERVAGTGVVIAAAVDHIVAHEILMARNIAGLPYGFFDGLRTGSWTGPLPPISLFVFACCAAAAYAAGIVALLHSNVTPAAAPRPQTRRARSNIFDQSRGSKHGHARL